MIESAIHMAINGFAESQARVNGMFSETNNGQRTNALISYRKRIKKPKSLGIFYGDFNWFLLVFFWI